MRPECYKLQLTLIFLFVMCWISGDKITVNYYQELKNTKRPDVLYHLLQCLQVLVLNTDALAEHKGFLIWCQENLLIEK